MATLAREMDLTLQEIAAIADIELECESTPEDMDAQISGVSIDSRTIKANEIYFAIRGETHDGHRFVQEAFDKQARAVVVERSWWRKQGPDPGYPTVFVVDDSTRALQSVAYAYRQKFAIPVHALTGTNGKTTTKEMVASVLGKTGIVCKTQGNLNNHIGVPLTLFTLEKHHDMLVLEMGTNHFGEIARLCEIGDPQSGLITNIGAGHLEFFKTLEGVARAKMELFEYLQPDGTVFVNIDDPRIVKLAPEVKKRIEFGFRDEARVFGERLEPKNFGQARMRVEGYDIELNLVGDHNLSNGLAAVAVGLEFGVPLPRIKEALESVQLPGKRMEVIRQGRLTILDDSYNANSDSTLAALKLLQQTPAGGKKIFIFGDMLELGAVASSEHARIGQAVPGFGVDVFLGFGPESAESVHAASKASKSILAKHFSDKKDLVVTLKSLIHEDDLLLVKGSRGMRMEEVIEELFRPNSN